MTVTRAVRTFGGDVIQARPARFPFAESFQKSLLEKHNQIFDEADSHNHRRSRQAQKE
jgi:hypothetical protein